jgi:hypothetical protein
VPPQQFQMQRVRVTLDPIEDLGQGNINTQVKEDGTFVLNNVADLAYRVNVTGMPAGGYLLAGRFGNNEALNAPLQIGAECLPLYLQIGFSPGQGDQPFAGGTAVLIPAARTRIDLYKTALTDQYGRFNFTNVVPGDYKVMAWEDIPSGAHLDTEFVRRFEERGKAIRVEKNGSVTVQVPVIPATQ